ncbi:MAG TPA: lytic transglycosylase domain-containing protein [Thermopetrobacter sp.]|nr:lytic transglycosylase domain-containing protein [Thermopetrobacter sp.]
MTSIRAFITASIALLTVSFMAPSASALSSTGVQAVRAALKTQFDGAARLARQSGDQAAMTLVEWLTLMRRNKDVSAQRLLNFAERYPMWPLAATIRAWGERNLMQSRDVAAIRRYYAQRRPASLYGRVALATALKAEGKRDEAARLIRAAWVSPALPGAAGTFILRHHRELLSRAAHEERLWRLITDQKTAAAARHARRLSAAHVRAAEAARALIRRRANGPRLFRALPAAMRNQPALRYAYARYWRRKVMPLKALSILERAPGRARQLDPERWWTEKRLVARQLLARNYRRHWPRAYRLAASHGFSGKSRQGYRGASLAGFIALRKLGRARAAHRHFLNAAKHARSRTQKSRAWYWVGRAREKLGDMAGARRAYAEAARTPTLYYALLAREKLGRGTHPLPIPAKRPSTAARAAVNGSLIGRAVRYLRAAGGKDRLRAFVWPLALTFKGERDKLAAAAALMWDAGGPAMAVRLAKAAGSIGVDIDNYGYPLRALPGYRHRGPALERAVLLGLIRQESEFDPKAGSRVGAQGLMQLMPGTARRVARRIGVGYHHGWLTARPSYNLMLGHHYLANLVQRFGGSYILAFAGYNAGPLNARKWLSRYGDFRSGEVDPIDWVEMIPFTETRTYVQKVMQNVHIYRARLGRKSIPISRDLYRGTGRWRPHVLRAGVSAPRPKRARDRRACKAGAGAGIADLIKACGDG